MPDVGELFIASFSRAVGDTGYNDEFIQCFYDLFMGKSTAIARLFQDTDMAVQKTMLHDSLHYMLEYYQSGVANVHLQHIKRVHDERGMNVPMRFYLDWLDSLIESVRTYDPQFDPETEKAWREVMAPGIAFMTGQSQPGD